MKKSLFLRILCISVAIPVLMSVCSCTADTLSGASTSSKSSMGGTLSGSSDIADSSAASSDAALSGDASSEMTSSKTSSAPIVKLFDPVEEGLTLTWSDEFDGTSLNTRKWGYLPTQVRDSCTWHKDATYVKDGNLVLQIKKASDGSYHAGAIRSYRKFSQAYGYFEVRCKAPTVYGVNAAFWLFGGNMNDNGQTGGVDGAEIDILETHKFNQKGFQHAIHWDGYGEKHGIKEQTVYKNIYDGQYHTFGFYWTKDKYVFYVDGKETWRTTAGGVCQVPLYLKLSVCTGGWIGDIAASNVPTDAMVVDYVRVYQLPNQ